MDPPQPHPFDIGEAHDVAIYLHSIAERVNRPVYFVLGNHDFYRGSIAGVRQKARELCSVTPNLLWISDMGVVPLTVATEHRRKQRPWRDRDCRRTDRRRHGTRPLICGGAWQSSHDGGKR